MTTTDLGQTAPTMDLPGLPGRTLSRDELAALVGEIDDRAGRLAEEVGRPGGALEDVGGGAEPFRSFGETVQVEAQGAYGGGAGAGFPGG